MFIFKKNLASQFSSTFSILFLHVCSSFNFFFLSLEFYLFFQRKEMTKPKSSFKFRSRRQKKSTLLKVSAKDTRRRRRRTFDPNENFPTRLFSFFFFFFKYYSPLPIFLNWKFQQSNKHLKQMALRSASCDRSDASGLVFLAVPAPW